MTLLIYAFFMGNQLMLGMAQFDSMESCNKQLPRVHEQYPYGGAACMPVKLPSQTDQH
jgi:hypothetical protein